LEKSKSVAPLFGSSASSDDDVKAFYAYWESFSSKMTFEWTDEYDPAEVSTVLDAVSAAKGWFDGKQAPNRAIRRAVEKENKKVWGEVVRDVVVGL
jgi:hypothetical protein